MRRPGFFGRLLRSVLRWLDRPYRTVVVADTLPERLRKKTLYIVRDDDFLEQAALLCPCGCRQFVHLNLLNDTRPCWTVSRHSDGTASLHPSIWRKQGCRSHFWFNYGRVEWCDDGSERTNIATDGDNRE